jgi:hypothetical protein
MIDEIAEILGVHRNSYFNYRKQNRPIINLIEKYFSKEDLEEFLKDGRISKIDNISIQNLVTLEYLEYSVTSKIQKIDFSFMFLFLLYIINFRDIQHVELKNIKKEFLSTILNSIYDIDSEFFFLLQFSKKIINLELEKTEEDSKRINFISKKVKDNSETDSFEVGDFIYYLNSLSDIEFKYLCDNAKHFFIKYYEISAVEITTKEKINFMIETSATNKPFLLIK